MKKQLKTIFLIIALILVIAMLGYVVYGFYNKVYGKKPNPIVTMEVEEFGTVKIELYPDMAPNTVSNFVKLINNGYYNGLTFHRVVKDFMIQGGDKKGDGTGNVTLGDLYPDKEENASDEYCIKGEFVANNYTDNKILFEKGVIAMARADYTSIGGSALRTQSYNSGGAQFFILTKDNSAISGQYAAFGKVIEGLDVIEKIENVEIETADETTETQQTSSDKPVNPPVIKSMTVETYGVDYGNPETVEPFDYSSWLMQQYGGSLSY